MKRVFLFTFIFMMLFLWSYGGRVLRVDAIFNSLTLSKPVSVVLDFPDTTKKSEVDYIKGSLWFKKVKFYNLNKNEIPAFDVKGPVIYFKIYKSGRENFFRSFLKLPENTKFSSKEIEFGNVRYYGDNLSTFFITSNKRLCFMASNVDILLNTFQKCVGIEEKSCYIFDNYEFVKSFIYDSDYSYSDVEIPVYWGVMDLNFFFKSLKDVHPAILAYRGVEEYLNLREELYNQLAIRSKGGYIKLKDFLYLLYRGAAFFGDGHTSISTKYGVNEQNSLDSGFLPFILRYRGGRFHVGKSFDTAFKNHFDDVIISINGRPPEMFFRPILDCCSGEEMSFRIFRFLKNQPFFFSMTGLLKPSENLKVKLSGGREIATKAISAKDFLNLWEKRTYKKQNKIIFHFFDGGKIGYFYLPEFKNNFSFRKEIKDIFNQIVSKGSKALIIDIRGNEGGNSSLGEYIASFITRKRIESFSGMDAKFSKEVVSSYFPTFPSELENITQEYTEKPYYPEKQSVLFKGRVYLLIDNGVFSSASAFSAMMKDFHLAKLIGYETGGRPSSFGDVLPLKLPYSCIYFGVSWKKFYRPNYTPENFRHGVIPDVMLNDKLLEKYKKKRDPFLSFVLNYVKEEIGGR